MSNFFQNYGAGGIPINTGFTPAGMVGQVVPGPYMPGPTSYGTHHQSPLSKLFGDVYTGAPYGFNALDNIGNMTIDQYNFGKVNTKFTAINTYLSVLGIGSWIIRDLCRFIITNKQTVWRRYDMMRVLTAQRVGHADIPDVTTSRTINWMSSGERYGQAADARLQELMDPEVGPIVAQRMLDTISAGIMHRLELSVIQQCRVEAAMRPWFESGGTLQTSEAYMDDEHLNRREHFGMLNYSPGVLGSRMSRFINKTMAGKPAANLIACLPYAARHRFTADPSFRYSTRQNVAADVLIDQFVGNVILGFTGMKRAEIFPLEASRDPALLGDGAAREFATIGGVRFYLEPPPSLNTGEQDSIVSVLNGHYTFATFVENPAFSDSNVQADFPDAVDVYDQGIDNMARLEAASALDATGVWKTGNVSYANKNRGLFPNEEEIYNGFSKNFNDYCDDLESSSAAALTNFYTLNIMTDQADFLTMTTSDMTRDYLIHPLVMVQGQGYGKALCIGHIHPRFLATTHVMGIAQRVIECVAAQSGQTPFDIEEVFMQIRSVVQYIKTIPFTAQFSNALKTASEVHGKVALTHQTVHLPSPMSYAEELARSTEKPASQTANSLFQNGLYAGCYSAPMLDVIASFARETESHQYASWMNTLSEYWPKWKAFVAKLATILPYSALLSANTLPDFLSSNNASAVTAATYYLFGGRHIAPKVAGDAARAAAVPSTPLLFGGAPVETEHWTMTDEMMEIDGVEKDMSLMPPVGDVSHHSAMQNRIALIAMVGATPLLEFVAMCYVYTPNTIQAWKTLASSKCGSLLPLKVVYSRWHQRFQGYALLLVETGGVTVYSTPVYSVFVPDQVNDMALLYGKVMQNIMLNNYDSAAVAECAYVRQQVCGRHTAYITSERAASWTLDRFRLSTTRESVIPFLEPIGHSLQDIITINNSISLYARRTLNVKGVPSIGFWHSMTFVTQYSHRNYFQESETARATKNVILPSSWTELLGNMNHLTNFATTYLSDNYVPNFCYRGFHIIPQKKSERPLVSYGYAGCPLNDVFWNAPGLNNNLANQKPIDEAEASAVYLRYA